MRRCEQCGRQFIPKSNPKQWFCDGTCQRRHAAQNKPRTVNATEETRAASRKAINARYWRKRKAHLSSVSEMLTDDAGQ